MTKSFLIEQYKTLVEGRPWHGEAVMKSLERIPIELMNAKRAGTAHSIAALIDHMTKWRHFAFEKLKKNQEFEIKIDSTADWNNSLRIDTKEQQKELIDAYSRSQIELIELIENLDESSFDKNVAGMTYTVGYLVWGILYHDIYHQGQINLLHAQLKNS